MMTIDDKRGLVEETKHSQIDINNQDSMLDLFKLSEMVEQDVDL